LIILSGLGLHLICSSFGFLVTAMQWLNTLLTDPNSIAHIVLVYMAIISIGLGIGRIKFFGISLGSIVVLFVGLAFSYFGVRVNMDVLAFAKDFGLIIFIFFIGLQVGPSFFSSFKSVGVVLNSLMVFGWTLGIVITISAFFLFSDTISLPEILGIHYGAVTNTPGLGATQEALNQLNYQGNDIAAAYACAYPLGLTAIIGVSIFLRWIFKIDMAEEDRHWDVEEREISQAPVSFHIYITNHLLDGVTITQSHERIPRPFICSRVMHAGEIISPLPETVLHVGDTIRVVSTPEHKRDIIAAFGKEDERINLETAHTPLVRAKFLVSLSSLSGRTIDSLSLAATDGVNITRVFRAGTELFPHPNLHIQVGDVLQCVGPENAVKRLEGRLGNQAKHLDQPNIAAIFMGMTLGIVFGSLPLAIPGMPTPIKLGMAGGPLIIAILLGRYGASLHLSTYMTPSSNLMSREIGISLFLASVGLSAGDTFVNALITGNGLLFALIGCCITVVPQLVVGIIARVFCKLNYHSIVGLLIGLGTNSPILAYASTLSEKNAAPVAYSTVYPLAMFLRIITGQLILLAMWSYVF